MSPVPPESTEEDLAPVESFRDGTGGELPETTTDSIAPATKASAPEPPSAPEPATSKEPGEHLPERNPEELAASRSHLAESAIRVDVNLLDKLMNLVGELVLCRNQILEMAASQSDTGFVATSQRLNLLTTELQEGVMKTRMQQIRTIWSKFPRVVRDMSGTLGKQVELVMEGEETELDKTLIEAIADPLTHLVRNCIDHGIELPEQRAAAGKPPAGRLFLRAFHESGHVNIEISDDGGGIDPETIKSQAIERGLMSSEKASRVSDREALNLIFLPGLSTAKQVTNLSGRGVGMDVVRSNIEKISGTIDIYSTLGAGTTFKLKIPLTLAIIPTMVIASGGDRYAIPQVSLLELVRLEGEQARQGIEMVHGAPVHRLRGKLLPLVYLNRELKIEPDPNDEQNGHHRHHERQTSNHPDNTNTLNIVVLQSGDKPFGLVVDAINDTQEIVVKPLGKQLKGIPYFAGATIMGDGKVALILDVAGLAQSAHLVSEDRDKALTQEAQKLQQQSENRQMLLLFLGPDNSRMAIPLSSVARLEEFPQNSVERTGSQEVIQYRDQILPLIRLDSMFSNGGYYSPQKTEEETLQLVVVSLKEDKNVGLVVENILDIVEEELKIKGPASRSGVECSAVIQGRVTEVLKVKSILEEQLPQNWVI